MLTQGDGPLHYSNLGEPGRENGYVLLALEPELVLK